jgi:hypothetical protein
MEVRLTPSDAAATERLQCVELEVGRTGRSAERVAATERLQCVELEVERTGRGAERVAAHAAPIGPESLCACRSGR